MTFHEVLVADEACPVEGSASDRGEAAILNTVYDFRCSI